MPKGIPAGKKVVIDTSCYIPYLNHPSQQPSPLAQLIFSNTEYLSAVVFAELRAGAHRTEDLRRLKELGRLFHRGRIRKAERRIVSLRRLKELGRLFHTRSRFLVPLLSDWELAEGILARLGRKFDMGGKGLWRLFNDVLIALSARRIGAVVIVSFGSSRLDRGTGQLWWGKQEMNEAWGKEAAGRRKSGARTAKLST